MEGESQRKAQFGGQEVDGYDQYTDDELRQEASRRGLPLAEGQDVKAALEESDRTTSESAEGGEPPDEPPAEAGQ